MCTHSTWIHALPRFAVLPLAVAALFAGCGGDGGGGPPPIEVPAGLRTVAASAGSDLSGANLDAYAGPLARAVLVATGNTLAGDAFGAQRESPAAVPAWTAAVGAGTPSLLTRSLSAWTARVRAARERPAAVETFTEPCPAGGWLTITFDDVDNNLDVSAADTLAIDADQCGLEPGAPALDGLFSITLRQVELDAAGEVTALDAACVMRNFSVGTFGTMDGGLRLRLRNDSATSQRVRLEYGDVVVRFGAESLVYNIDVYSVGSLAGHNHVISGGLGIAAQTYQVVPAEGEWFPVASDGELPASGSLRLRDAAGDALLLRAKAGGSVDLEFYPMGATAPSAAQYNVPWDEFRLPAP